MVAATPTVPELIRLVDPVLIQPFRWCSEPVLALWIGSAVLAAVAVLAGLATLRVARAVVGREAHDLTEEARRYQELSMQALRQNDKPAYAACNSIANEAFGRNFLESLGTKEARDVVDLVCRGDRFTFFDVRFNFTAAKATETHFVRPGSDYAIALALAHTLIREDLYDAEFAANWIAGLDEFAAFVQGFTPEFAEQASGVAAATIVQLARDLADAAPHVIVHPGWMTAWRSEDFYLRRALYALNALLGAYEAPGGLVFPKGAGHCGVTLRELAKTVPKPETTERCDGVGTEIKHLGASWGLVQRIPEVAATGTPYPIKGYIVMRHDPMASPPDPDAFLEGLNHLELVVSIDVNWSVTAWHADVVLPECTFLERTDNPIVRSGLKPKLALRQQAMEPRFDSRPRWWIFKQLADRLGFGEHFPYETTGLLETSDWIHPEVAYTLHGFGDVVPDRTRSFNSGFSDVRLAKGQLKTSVGGNCPVTETVISIRTA